MRTKSLISLLLTIALIAVSGYLLIHFKVFQKHINLGLDLQGGLHVVMEAVDTPEAPVTDDSLDRVKAVIERRVNETGVKEPIIQREGKRRLIVELAGIKNPDAAIDLIGKTAVLQFKTSDGKVVVSGSDLKDAQAAKNPTTGEIYVALEFNKEGTKKFADVTSELVQKYSETDPRRRIGIYLDQQQLQNPVVREPIPNGRAQINGYNTLEEAAKMAVLLRSGALPVNMEKVYTQTVGPTLGADSLAKSTKAGIVGIIAILIFMIAYYRIPGLIANVALAAYALIVLGLLAALQATLTLPGIAGFLLSIGMAVDANIIIFERVKEELREGNSLRRSIESGFSRAFWTVFDSNVTTLIAAAILYYFGTGAIRGFAVTLSIGILASMFTAITLTRFMLRNLADSKLITNKKLYGA
ncbi:protein translocase subunit SecD [Thermincola potens]|uniref:Protein translocase subunit SecD n=1 Tax=Thermincola potens (strain JR) TaxID=635013 RepID=D5XEJ6_THEPJ|nr:protein translocase subunit SecD [Thermincola potens]ADG82067.1 protein-export membrane protein SecD [Thermincola potens JR]